MSPLLTLFLAVPLLAPAPEARPADSKPKVPKELLGKRADAARKVYEWRVAVCEAGKIGPDDLCDWSERLLLAELALHSKKKDRVKAIRDYLDRSRYAEKIAQAKKNAGSATQVVVDMVTYYRLDAEIRLAEEGEKPHPAK